MCAVTLEGRCSIDEEIGHHVDDLLIRSFWPILSLDNAIIVVTINLESMRARSNQADHRLEFNQERVDQIITIIKAIKREHPYLLTHLTQAMQQTRKTIQRLEGVRDNQLIIHSKTLSL